MKNDDENLDELTRALHQAFDARQMFDPPYERIAVAGRPIAFIPDSDIKYRSFLDWWFKVGRKAPHDPLGWSTISGPWVMEGRTEAIPRDEWDALPEAERKLITAWAHNLPVGMFYD